MSVHPMGIPVPWHTAVRQGSSIGANLFYYSMNIPVPRNTSARQGDHFPVPMKVAITSSRGASVTALLSPR